MQHQAVFRDVNAFCAAYSDAYDYSLWYFRGRLCRDISTNVLRCYEGLMNLITATTAAQRRRRRLASQSRSSEQLWQLLNQS